MANLMKANSSARSRLSRQYASLWLWMARVAWLSLAFVSLTSFGQGIPIYAAQLRWTYGADLGFSVQQGHTDELILMPNTTGQAAQAGVMARDVLLSVDGSAVDSDDLDALTAFFAGGPAGSVVTLQLRTGTQPPREIRLIRGGETGAWLNRFSIPITALVAVALGVEFLVTFGFVAAAAFIFWRGSQTLITWLSSLLLVLLFAGTGSLPVQSLYAAELDWQYALDIWNSLMVAALLLWMFLFPNGCFVPRWAVLVLPIGLVWVVAAWLWPELYFWRLGSWSYVLGLFVILTAGVTAQLWRFRFVSSRHERQQTKWVVWGLCLALTAVFLQFATAQLLSNWPLLNDMLINPLARLLQLVVPITFLLAIFQHRLWEIDVIVNRTLVYGGLTLAVVAAYTLIVGGLGALLQAQGNTFLALLATGLIAVLFQPVREKLQRNVNRLMFGERDDPYAVLSQLGSQLQTTNTPEAMLRSVVETVAATLKLPFVAVELADELGRRDGVHIGAAVAEPVEFPLRYQNETVGYLVVSPRSPSEQFSLRENKLLTDIATQTGAIASSVRLLAALQRSREKLILAREEERRRIRRDLHDELGPTLASQTFVLDAVLDLMASDPPEARRLLQSLKAQNQETVAEIRRLVYALRPPALDELGLLGALQAHVTKLDSRSLPHIQLTAEPAPLQSLSAAVEVAAYRIALEAITNVVRHAQATRCDVSLQVMAPSAASAGRPFLQISISDDGVGLPEDCPPGVGLNSMRERAEELGGSFQMVAADDGVRIMAALPLATYPGER